eukprot:CAMPEP_0174257578 /NCGR_PEP_ID=MMETSP0439-20130205/6701_1 /TAXON_ID=0 /ORGANISM="Stereomyxa ramosa, Strain Chinc5" /LENGTH=404 /DNA_ID=CAMNT_0015340731 /DNA_START=1201 /DNA_END=2415 /DNA_ORIENTATION=+
MKFSNFSIEDNPILEREEEGEEEEENKKYCLEHLHSISPSLPTISLFSSPLPAAIDWLHHEQDEQKVNVRNKIYGCIFGQAIGDAIGLASEFQVKKKAQYCYGLSTISYHEMDRDTHQLRWEPGDFTDDTDQMILILDNLLRHDGVPHVKEYAESLWRWALQGFPEMGDRGGMGIGNTVKSVLEHPHFLQQPHQVAEEIWLRSGKRAAANGAVMRTSVVGLVNYEDLDRVIDNTIQYAKVTHRDGRCIASCIAVTVAIALLLQREGMDIEESEIEEIVEIALEKGKEAIEREEYLTELQDHILAENIFELKLGEGSSIGYTFKCCGSGFVSFRKESSFEVAIMKILREGGDADTNGAVAGALMGAKLGFTGLPFDWVDNLLEKDWLSAYAEKLCVMALGPTHLQ